MRAQKRTNLKTSFWYKLEGKFGIEELRYTKTFMQLNIYAFGNLYGISTTDYVKKERAYRKNSPFASHPVEFYPSECFMHLFSLLSCDIPWKK